MVDPDGGPLPLLQIALLLRMARDNAASTRHALTVEEARSIREQGMVLCGEHIVGLHLDRMIGALACLEKRGMIRRNLVGGDPKMRFALTEVGLLAVRGVYPAVEEMGL